MPAAARVMSPAGFHGQHAMGGAGRGPFFEGWYVKLVSADQRTRVALIPGMFRSQDGAVSESFVQVLDGVTGTTRYHRLELSELRADAGRFDVHVGTSRFAATGAVVDLPGLRADVRFGPLRPWPVSLAAPGAMGWYAWVPTMECYHGVVSMDHRLSGWIDLGAGRVDLAGGRGYLEKDWGSAFPTAYVWMQSNHFDVPGASLMASTALIPWRRSAFRGDLVGLLLPEGPAAGLTRLATYTGARTRELVVSDGTVDWVIDGRDGRRLELRAVTRGRATGLLHAPVRTQMHRRVAETLDAEVAVRLSDRTGRTLFEGTGTSAGVEVHGPMDRLLSTPTKQWEGWTALVRTWAAGGGRLTPRRGRKAPEKANRRVHGQG